MPGGDLFRSLVDTDIKAFLPAELDGDELSYFVEMTQNMIGSTRLATCQSLEDGTFELSCRSPIVGRDTFSVAARTPDPEGLAGEKNVALAEISSHELSLGDVLVKGLPVVTVLVRSAGAPVQGARVDFAEITATFSGTDDASFHPHTDSFGFARHGTASRFLQIRVEAPGLAIENRHVRGACDTTVEVELVPGARISGTVHAADGRALEGVSVSLSDAGDSPSPLSQLVANWPVAHAETDKSGRFELEGTHPGRPYVVDVTPPPALLPTNVTVLSPTSSADVVLEPGSQLVVSVARKDGIALVDSTLEAIELEQRAPDADEWEPASCAGRLENGTVVFEPLPPGIYRACAGAPNPGKSAPVELKAGGLPARVRLELSAGRTIHGRVVDARGCAVEGAIVTDRDDSNSTTTDSDGCYTLSGVREEAVWLLIVKVAGSEVSAAHVEVARGASRVADAVLEAAPR
jgi:hypothetical protein